MDISLSKGNVELVAELNLEAILAGIDMANTTSTEGSKFEPIYEGLRRQNTMELQEEFIVKWPDLSGKFMLSGRGRHIPLALEGTDIPDIGDPTLPRLSKITLSGFLPHNVDEITFGWSPELGEMVLRVADNGESGFAGYVDPGDVSPPILVENWEPQKPGQVFFSFIPVGFKHILPLGLDHILFVIGLFLMSAQLRPLLLQISTFTLAHTFTLALGALELVQVSPEVVEPLIALSIVYVAVENIITPKVAPWRLGLIFAFGLLHGLGFASVLSEFGLPETGLIPALLGFNIGVELGQLAVIVLCLGVIGIWFRNKPWYRSRITIPISIVISCIGLWWTFERAVLGMMG